ncbi:MAG: hypothetical protein D3915_04000 [Candidatus Electrothrix sp. AU1_5]|nr:hypothetical protein [Candidatus Electrothrix gigas]MCI5192280.1 hypothetical protein [Candidatus Electrothrix gigas]
MLQWDDYSIHDLVALDQQDEHVKYMTKTLTAFKAVEKIYELKKERDQEAMTEHGIILSFLKKLTSTFELLRLKYLFHPVDRLKIDKSDSGFVNFYEISQLEVDLHQKKNRGIFQDKEAVLKERILSHLLHKQTDPDELLAEMAQNAYQKGLVQDNLFLFFNEGKLIRQKNENPSRRKYLYYWACYDKKSNMPYIYLLDFEQDAEEKALHVNSKAFDTFVQIIRSEGSRAPAVGIVAMAIDQRLDSIHPKMLKRLCIGPIYSQSFSVNLPKETEQLFATGDEGRKFVFHLTEQFVFSIGQSVIKDQKVLGSLLTEKRVRERFYIPKATDVDEYSVYNELERQKASLIRKTVVMPYKLHQHVQDVQDMYSGFKVISFSRHGIINGL